MKSNLQLLVTASAGLAQMSPADKNIVTASIAKCELNRTVPMGSKHCKALADSITLI